MLSALAAKEWISFALYVASIPAAFVSPYISIAIFVGVSIVWLIPDRRFERSCREERSMTTARLTSFTDGVIAIIITIMVLELPVPKAPGMAALQPLSVLFAAYALSFVKVGIYWSQHHNILQASKTGERAGAARQPVLPVLAEPCAVRRPLGRRSRASPATPSLRSA